MSIPKNTKKFNQLNDKYHLILLMMFVGVSNFAAAQKTYFKTYFSGSNVYDFIESDSNIWCATESKIVKMNTFTNEISYFQLPGIPPIYDYKYYKFLKEPSGKLWIGGEKGLFYLSDGNWFRHPKFNEPKTFIKMFQADPKSGIWFADIFYDQLYFLNGDSVIKYPLNSSNVREVAIFDRNKDLWLDQLSRDISDDIGIYRMRDSFVIIPVFGDASWHSKAVLSVCFTEDNTLYMSGIAVKNQMYNFPSDYLVQYKNGVWTDIFSPVLDNNDPGKLKNILVESNGEKWVTTSNYLINFSADSLRVHYVMRSPITNIKQISDDRIFLGTKNPEFPYMGVGDGAFILKNGSILDSKKFGNGQFNTNNIIALSVDKDSILWVAGLYDHLSLKTQNGWKEYYTSQLSVPLMPDVILQKQDTTIVTGDNGVHYWYDNEWHFKEMDFFGTKHAIVGSNGNVYVSAYHRSVCEVNLNSSQCYSNLKFSNNNTNDFDKPFCKDKNGRVWVGSGNFLYHTNDTGGWTQVNTSKWGWPELGDKTRMNFDSKNHLWITTGNRHIYEYNGKFMIKHSPNYTNKVYPYYVGNTIVTDSSGSVFIGTYWDGLYRYDGENWHVYDTSNSGLLNNNINAIALKNNGLWLGSELGVVDFTNFGSGKRVSNLRDTVANMSELMPLYNVKLFPNPSNGKFTIESQESQELDYEIFNIEGRLIKSGTFKNSINLEIAAPGFYICRVIDPSKDGVAYLKFMVGN